MPGRVLLLSGPAWSPNDLRVYPDSGTLAIIVRGPCGAGPRNTPQKEATETGALDDRQFRVPLKRRTGVSPLGLFLSRDRGPTLDDLYLHKLPPVTQIHG